MFSPWGSTWSGRREIRSLVKQTFLKHSWSSLQFCDNECVPNSAEGRDFRKSIKPIPSGEACDCSQGSEVTGIDSSSISDDSMGLLRARPLHRWFNSNQKCGYLMGCIEGSSCGRHLCCSLMVHIIYIILLRRKNCQKDVKTNRKLWM